MNTLQTVSDSDSLNAIVTEINRILPQLSNFIEQFNTTASQNNVTVMTDVNGNMSMDVPLSMPEVTYKKISLRLGIIDSLITDRGNCINGLFQEGLKIEKGFIKADSNYTSKLIEQISKFEALNSSYKH
jgi:hypothetical protein